MSGGASAIEVSEPDGTLSNEGSSRIAAARAVD
jgi:hypothetical protein